VKLMNKRLPTTATFHWIIQSIPARLMFGVHAGPR
jgi:hypothetical protein